MSGTPERVVFIDTTELMAKGKSPVFAGGLRQLAQSGADVVTSSLVLDELVANYSKHRHEVVSKYGRYFPADRLPEPRSFRCEFAEHLDSVGVVVLPLAVLLQDVIHADLKGGQPFKKEGEGYRDFINWATFVDRVKATGALRGAFLTANSKDFGDPGKLPSSLSAVAESRGCRAELQALSSDDYFKLFPQTPTPPKITKEHLDRAVGGWISIVEDGDLLWAMHLPGPGPGIELKVIGVRDKEAEVLRGPLGGAVQMIFRATFDCIVIVDSQLAAARGWPTASFLGNQPWVTGHRTVRLEWTVEAPYDEKNGVTSMPVQVAPLRRLDPITGKRTE